MCGLNYASQGASRTGHPLLTKFWTHRLFHGKELDDILMVQLPQDLKLSHLHLVGAPVAGSIEDLHSDQLPGFLSWGTRL